MLRRPCLEVSPSRAGASRHPVRAKSEGAHFLHGASTPPLRGGESPLRCRIRPISKFLPALVSDSSSTPILHAAIPLRRDQFQQAQARDQPLLFSRISQSGCTIVLQAAVRIS